MGILPSPKPEGKAAATPTKRRSLQTDIAKLPPLKAATPAGFSGFRDPSSASPAGVPNASGKNRGGMVDDDSDDGEDDPDRGLLTRDMEEVEPNGDVMAMSLAAAEDDQRGELAEAVRKIKLKRAHSSDVLDRIPRKSAASTSPPTGRTPQVSSDHTATPPSMGGINNPGGSNHTPYIPGASPAAGMTPAARADEGHQFTENTIIGSPMKKSRPSLAGAEDEMVRKRLGLGLFGSTGEALAGVTFSNPSPSTSGGGVRSGSVGGVGGGGGGGVIGGVSGVGGNNIRPIEGEQIKTQPGQATQEPGFLIRKEEDYQQQPQRAPQLETEDVMIKDAEEEIQEGGEKLEPGEGSGTMNPASTSSS